MHIVDVAEFYAPLGGGVKTYIHEKLAYAAQNGIRMTIIAPGRENRIEDRGSGRIHYVKSPAIPIDRRYHLFSGARPIHRLLDELAPDIVEASSPWRAAAIVAGWKGPVADGAKKALVMHADAVAAHPQTWFRNILSPRAVDRACFWYWARLRRLSRAYHTVIVGSHWFGQRLLTAGGIPSTVVPLGVDTTLFHPQKRDPEYRRRLLHDFGLPATATLLIGVGRHHPEKQWPVVFEAVGALASQNIAMVQVGSGFLGNRLAAAASRAGNVHLIGQIRNRARLATLLASADALVHGSRAETFGLVTSEALASGLPLVLPSEGGGTDIADPRWSETYAPGDSSAACAAIERLLTRNRKALRAAACEGRRLRVSTPGAHFERLFSLYGEKDPRAPARTHLEPLPATV